MPKERSRSTTRRIRSIRPKVMCMSLDIGHNVVDKFTSSGAYIGQVTGTIA